MIHQEPHDDLSWKEGYAAGREGAIDIPPDGIASPSSWFAGYQAGEEDSGSAPKKYTVEERAQRLKQRRTLDGDSPPPPRGVWLNHAAERLLKKHFPGVTGDINWTSVIDAALAHRGVGEPDDALDCPIAEAAEPLNRRWTVDDQRCQAHTSDYKRCRKPATTAIRMANIEYISCDEHARFFKPDPSVIWDIGDA